MTAIDAKNLRYRYPDQTEALRGLTLRIGQGERVCLAGPNGAGKSTLLLCLAGLLKAEGHLEIQGARPAINPASFGLVFQHPDDQLFCPTIGEDVAFGPRNQKQPEAAVAGRVAKALGDVGLSGFERRCAHHLSGGEKKSAAIAAVLACEPKILALDEPWANLDARASRAVTKIMEHFTGTLLVASHDLPRAAALCSRMIVVDGGGIVADGPMKDILADPPFLEAHGLEP